MTNAPCLAIGDQHLREVLSTILHASTLSASNPLQYLSIIDAVLADPAFPPIANARHYALTQLVLTAIYQSLQHQRQALGLAPLLLTETRHQACQHLRHDLPQGASELIAWSILYYRYVRTDLNVALTDFYDCLGIHARTFRRYHQHGTQRLLQGLVQEEWRLGRASLPVPALPLRLADDIAAIRGQQHGAASITS